MYSSAGYSPFGGGEHPKGQSKDIKRLNTVKSEACPPGG